MDPLLEELQEIFRDIFDQPNLVITRGIKRFHGRRLGLFDSM